MGEKEEYRKQRNVAVWSGLGLLILSRILASIWLLSLLIWLVGLGVVIWGSWSWAKYKGRSGWWALWGLLAPVGFIPLALMRDKYISEE